jgi:transcription factor CP2-like protein
MKKTPSEQAKLQPSYECTVLSDISLESLDSPPPAVHSQGGHQTLLSPSYSIEHPAADSPENISHTSPNANNGNHGAAGNCQSFSAHFSPESVRRWLVKNRFSASKTLWDFSGLDLLRLGKEELIEICGLPEGIRLYNALHYKITFYVFLSNGDPQMQKDAAAASSPARSEGGDPVYHPICLSAPSISEMTSVIGSLCYNQFPSDTLPVDRLLLSVLAPGSTSRIRVLLTEQLLTTLKDQSAFKAYKVGSEVYLELIEG